MASLLDVLHDALDGPAVAALAREVGIDPAVAIKAIDAALPALIERLDGNASDEAGAAELATAVAEDHDATLLDSAADFLGGSFRAGPGMGILRHVFGDQLALVTGTLARQTGLPPSIINLILTALAPLVLSAITKAAIGAVTAAAVTGLLKLAATQVQEGRVQQMMAGVNDRLDADGDGNAADDVGRSVLDASGRAGRAVVGGVSAFTRDERVQRAARTTAQQGARIATQGATQGVKLAQRAAGAAGSAIRGWLGR